MANSMSDTSVKLQVPLPQSLVRFHALLEMFFAGMLHKLDINSYKQTPTLNTISEIIEKLEEEICEFEEQMFADPHDDNAMVELMDIANYAFLAYVAIRRNIHLEPNDKYTGL